MNILFINTYKSTVNTNGGIARVTCNLGRLFTQNGYHCSMAYYYDSIGEVDDCFMTTEQLTFHHEKSVLEQMATTNEYFIIQAQMTKAYLHLVPVIDNIRKKFGTKVIYCHHSVPFTEATGYDFNFLKFLLFHSTDKLAYRLKESLWCLASIISPRYTKRRIAARRQYVTDHVDIIVLLSDTFIAPFREYVKCTDDKVTAIGNCVTFKEVLNPVELNSKEKTVLIVSNMNEKAKRISSMIKIWKETTDNGSHPGWKLILVGDGPDLNYYKKLVSHLKLTNCIFTGTCNPLPYYKKGSLLMLGSAYEGFGMVIVEAQQMGCVPVVYESYESVHDLITDGENGLLVENKNHRQFASKLSSLMTDENERHRIALNCINMENRFSTNVIYSQWKSLFDSLQESKEK